MDQKEFFSSQDYFSWYYMWYDVWVYEKIKKFEKELNLSQYTDQELEAHDRVLHNLSEDSGVNILEHIGGK